MGYKLLKVLDKVLSFSYVLIEGNKTTEFKMEQEIVEVYQKIINGNMTLEEFNEWVEQREDNAYIDG